jgi:hypothetical protein
MAHACWWPAETISNVSPPETGVGSATSTYVPVPSWKESLFPQQYPAPANVTPQTNPLPPAEMLLKANPPGTALGDTPWADQQYALPSAVRPHVMKSPDVSAVNSSPPGTSYGVVTKGGASCALSMTPQQ